jgi:outer membrane protein assembly factor BamE
MKKIISFILIASTLSGCSVFRPHKTEVAQGNIISQQEVNQLHHGMSESQVKAIMGTPLLVNVFTPSRVDYVYTIQEGYNDRQTQHLTCIFRNGRLQEIVKS